MAKQLGDLPAFGRSRGLRGKGGLDLDSALGSLLEEEAVGKPRASRSSRLVEPIIIELGKVFCAIKYRNEDY